MKKLLTIFLIITTVSVWANDEAKTRAIQNEAKARALENEARVRAIRDSNLLRMQEMSGQGLNTEKNENLSYAEKIRMSIKPNITFTEEVAGNPKATVVILVNDQGQIYSRDLIEKSGIDSWDQAVLKAIDRTKVLPKDTNGKVPPKLEISFRPKA